MRKEKLPVIFRADRTGKFKGSITAVFPTLPGTNSHNMTCYGHVGQHSACDMGWYVTTRAARPAEFGGLLTELIQIYDDVELVVYKRMTAAHHNARRRA